MIWKDRKYINPRKRVFKNMDTDEILNLEIQDDPENIEEESETPLNAHNLNLSQQDLLDDMSKTYTGTNITGPTVEGYGTIHKLYGHTIEEGSGEKSPSNPYTLRCVGDDVNLYNENSSKVGSFIDGSGAEVSGSGYLFINQIIIPTALKYTMSYNEATQNANVRFSYYNNNTFLSREVGHDNKHIFTIPANCTKIDVRVDTGVDYFKGLKLQKGSTATPYSPYNQGTLEIISQNGDQQSSNVVVTKPLCSLQDNEGNIIAQDYIDYTRGVVHRECGYVVLDGSQTIYYMEEENDTARFRIELFEIKKGTNFGCDKLKVIKQSEAIDEECLMIRDLSVDNSISFKIKKSRLTELSSTGINNYLASNPITLICELAEPTEEPLNCSNKIVQYSTQTTVSNRDGAEIEVSLTNNKAIAEVNGDIGNVQNELKLKDTGWIDLKLNLGSGTLKYRKIGNIVNVIGKINGIAGQWKVVATLPYKPIIETLILLGIGNTKIGTANFKADGSIQLLYHNLDGGDFVASDSISINHTYVTD